MEAIVGGKAHAHIGENIGIGKSVSKAIVQSKQIPPPDSPPPVISYDLIFSQTQNSVYIALF